MQESYLQHHGILGMHWGIRRYQNPDGSLTSAGKSRIKTYNKAEKLKSSGNKEKYKEFKSSNKKEIKEGKKLDIKVREQDLPFYQKSGFKKTSSILLTGIGAYKAIKSIPLSQALLNDAKSGVWSNASLGFQTADLIVNAIGSGIMIGVGTSYLSNMSKKKNKNIK